MTNGQKLNVLTARNNFLLFTIDNRKIQSKRMEQLYYFYYIFWSIFSLVCCKTPFLPLGAKRREEGGGEGGTPLAEEIRQTVFDQLPNSKFIIYLDQFLYS